jgi:hypothetical protein
MRHLRRVLCLSLILSIRILDSITMPIITSTDDIFVSPRTYVGGSLITSLTSNGCTQYSDYTWNDSLCRRLPSSDGPFSRYLELGDNGLIDSNNVSMGLESCLPGPSNCSMTYTGRPCPSAYTAWSTNIVFNITTEYCCPLYVLLACNCCFLYNPVGYRPPPLVSSSRTSRT